MSQPMSIGKREFIQHTSKYIKMVEENGQSLIITHHHQPELVLSRIQSNSIKDLRGSVTIEIVSDINEHVLPGYDEWSS